MVRMKGWADLLMMLPRILPWNSNPEVGGNTARNQKRTLGQMQDLAQGLASYLVVLLNRLT
jgi:hypothetical protein